MKREEFLKLIEETIDADDELTEDSVLDNIEDWDSLSVISVLALINKHFGFRPQVNDLKNCKTIKDVLDLANGKYE